MRQLIEPPTAAITAVNASPAERDTVTTAYEALIACAKSANVRLQARRTIMLALLDQDAHPSRRSIAANLFDRSERYMVHSAPEALLDDPGLYEIISAWLAGDGERTRAAYAAWLLSQERIALAGLT